MNLIFNQSPSQDLYVYIHCKTAGAQLRLTQKMHTHSEYDTAWSKSLEEWKTKGYFVHFIQKELSSRNDVMTILEFTNSISEDFIKELSSYLQGEQHSGYLSVGYKRF